jgi:hypothetical protein
MGTNMKMLDVFGYLSKCGCCDELKRGKYDMEVDKEYNGLASWCIKRNVMTFFILRSTK